MFPPSSVLSVLLRFNKFLAATSRSHAILSLQCGTVQSEDGRGGGTWIFKETWGLTVQCSNTHRIFSRGPRCCWNMVDAPGRPRGVSLSPPWAMRMATASGSQHGIRAWDQTILYFKDRPLNLGTTETLPRFLFRSVHDDFFPSTRTKPTIIYAGPTAVCPSLIRLNSRNIAIQNQAQ